jgi:hypothetical protein
MIDVNTTVQLTLTAGHCVTILQGLDELPHKHSRAVIDELRRQIAEAHPQAFEQPPEGQRPLANGHMTA